MAINNFIPTVWSREMFRALKKAHVFANVVNTDYQGEINNFGDTVKITGINAITIGDYTKNSTTVSAETLDDAQTELKIDQAKYFAFQIDDVDAAQQTPKIMQMAMEDAGYGLADQSDQYIAKLQSDAGHTVTQTSLTAAKMIAVLGSTSQKLNEANVPTQGRWVVLPPFAINLLVQAEVLALGGIETTGNYRNGFVGRAFGFDIFMSNNLEVVSTNTVGLAGTRRAISYANQIKSIEAYRPEGKFADAVKGLYLFGAKVVDPNALVKLVLKV